MEPGLGAGENAKKPVQVNPCHPTLFTTSLCLGIEANCCARRGQGDEGGPGALCTHMGSPALQGAHSQVRTRPCIKSTPMFIEVWDVL